ncbi:hypothetical protein HBH64_026970 [Parastagonospora nodorum]|nr:hypothetical protein HBH47_055650 [Parastagonospora nodorum]KAH4300649.1 hypothetical protein HBI02_152950 [Parastagonospora nodorum]KAH4307158.1 hypothetical protein HBI01_051930 [Parastagonospora nodorum]KAH4336966.1 hypothetical protein HBI00_015570 [Parastagonospora nodorum]KAH4382699.1 hypothetical protein HBH94_060110 [Parastagonospora nodorum]
MCRDRRSSPQAIFDPKQCPFTIRQLNKTTWLVRENDQYSEHPHIYIKKYTNDSSSVLIITDTGVGTSTPRPSPHENWTLASFIQHHFNPTLSIPYLVVLSHCHYDHILGLSSLLSSPAHVTICASGQDPGFITPYENLQEHSLCADLGLHAPQYEIDIWAGNGQGVKYTHPDGGELELPILTFHTPGHTPDSLTWMDTQERVLYVGDSFYTATSPDSHPDEPALILFPNEGDLTAWWNSVKNLLDIVQTFNNQHDGDRMKISSGHVSVGEDAEEMLGDVKGFMARVLRGDVEGVDEGRKRGEEFGVWREEGRFGLGAPVGVVRRGRESIPTGEWER